jgi:hypothetical protein
MSVSKADMQPKIGTASQYLLVFLVCVPALPCALCFPNKRLWSRLLEPCNLELVFFFLKWKIAQMPRDRERCRRQRFFLTHAFGATGNGDGAWGRPSGKRCMKCNAKARVEQRREVHGSLIIYKTVGQGYIYLTLLTHRFFPLEPREPSCNPGWNFKASKYQWFVGI